MGVLPLGVEGLGLEPRQSPARPCVEVSCAPSAACCPWPSGSELRRAAERKSDGCPLRLLARGWSVASTDLSPAVPFHELPAPCSPGPEAGWVG